MYFLVYGRMETFSFIVHKSFKKKDKKARCCSAEDTLFLGVYAVVFALSSKTLQIIRGMHETWKDIDKQAATEQSKRFMNQR